MSATPSPNVLPFDPSSDLVAPLQARARWTAERWPAVLTAVVAIPLTAFCIASTLYWPGRPFPGFFVMGNAVIPTVGLSEWTGPRAGIPFHAQVVAADRNPVRTSADLYAYVASVPVGTPIHYTLTKATHALEATAPTMRFGLRDYWLTVGLMNAFGVLAVGAGLIVAFLQPQTAAARAFLCQAVLSGLSALTGNTMYHPDHWWLSRLQFFTHAAFPAAFIHLGLVFPVARRFVIRQPAWLAVPYLIAIALTLWVWIDFYASPPRTTPLYFLYFYTAVSIVVLIGLLGFSYWENRTPAVRRALNVVLPGFVLGAGLGLFGWLDATRLGGHFPTNLMALTPIIFYLAIGYAIARHDLFDIDALVKQALVYGALTLLITVAYAGTLIAMGLLFPLEIVQGSRSFNISFVVLIAVLFQPARTRLQAVIDRTFFRARLDYRETVRRLSADLTTLLDLNEVLDRVGRTLSEGLQPQSLAAALWLDGTPRAWRYAASSGRMEPDAATGAIPHAAIRNGPPRTWRAPEPGRVAASLGLVGQLVVAPGTPANGRPARPAIVVPLALGERVIGAYLLGPKRSGRPYSREDLDILDTLAAESAIAIQNATSYRELAVLNTELDAKVKERTAELERSYRELQTTQAQLVQTEKMASLGSLVAGLAHEINNPISFVVTNLGPLRKRIEALQAAAAEHGDERLARSVAGITEVLDIIARGAERTAGIVRDMRTFSGPGSQHPKPVDVHEGLDMTLRLLRQRWDGRIEIHRSYGALPAVEAAPGQINQVFMNVLANACDAIETTGNIWIRTSADDAVVRIRVRDDGLGIAPADLGRVFDPFFTTKPVGSGTGLGLAISHGIVTHHGGTIDVQSTLGTSTEVTITLPLRQPATAAQSA